METNYRVIKIPLNISLKRQEEKISINGQFVPKICFGEDYKSFYAYALTDSFCNDQKTIEFIFISQKEISDIRFNIKTGQSIPTKEIVWSPNIERDLMQKNEILDLSQYSFLDIVKNPPFEIIIFYKII
ncbi:MAG: hypothetical protein PHR00_04360 [Patescibacteria group bacterium]|nr:hypothetical protein [Patescibacteria group bacterium]